MCWCHWRRSLWYCCSWCWCCSFSLQLSLFCLFLLHTNTIHCHYHCSYFCVSGSSFWQCLPFSTFPPFHFLLSSLVLSPIPSYPFLYPYPFPLGIPPLNPAARPGEHYELPLRVRRNPASKWLLADLELNISWQVCWRFFCNYAGSVEANKSRAVQIIDFKPLSHYWFVVIVKFCYLSKTRLVK